jgi:hypothetical protein
MLKLVSESKTRVFTFPIISIMSIVLVFLFAGCTPNNPQPNPPTPSNSVGVSWQGTVDGNSYSYSGTYVNLASTSTTYNNPGKSEGSANFISLAKGVVPGTVGENIGFEISMPLILSEPLVGTHILNNTSNNGYQIAISKQTGNSTTSFTASATYPNSNVVLNITEFPSTIGGLIKGNFSGQFGTYLFDNTAPTKNASITFEAIRLF